MYINTYYIQIYIFYNICICILIHRVRYFFIKNTLEANRPKCKHALMIKPFSIMPRVTVCQLTVLYAAVSIYIVLELFIYIGIYTIEQNVYCLGGQRGGEEGPKLIIHYKIIPNCVFYKCKELYTSTCIKENNN